MKCPLMIAHVPLAMSEDNPAVGDCIKEKCAWWNKSLGICTIAVPGYLTGRDIERREAKSSDDQREV